MTLLIVGIVLVALAIMVVVYAAVAGSSEPTGVARSLQMLEQRPTSREVSKRELSAQQRVFDPLLNGLRRFAFRISPSGTGSRIARSLDRAGNPPAWSVERLMGAKGLGLVIGVVVPLLFLGFSLRGLLIAALLGAAGFFIPDLLLYNTGLKRQKELQRGLADSLDMLTVCVEAGLGFDAAILQVAKSVEGPIAGEFARVLSEMQIGKSRGEAFASLGERTTAPEIKAFVSALVQADRLGLPVAVVLREQTKEMRVVRRQRAEEQAQKVTVKILFPLLLCIFPALFIVIIGPGAIRIITAFSNF